MSDQSTLIARLRAPKITHHQINHDYEPYKTATKAHPVETIKLEAADEIERLQAAYLTIARQLEQQAAYSANADETIESLRAALAELVACKRLKGRIEDADHPMPAALREYHQRQPAAWADAFALVDGETK